MYITLGLLWLVFGIIHAGTRCPMGGLIDENLCKKLIDESVLNRFYISSFTKTVSKNSKVLYDKPYKSFIQKENEKGSLFNLVKTRKSDDSEPSTQQKYRIKFKQSIILDPTFVAYQYDFPYKMLIGEWNATLSTGTDVYRLKFHSKIVREIEKKGISNLLNGEILVCIQSYYNAASTYYFSRNYVIADIVLKEGLEFLKSVTNKKEEKFIEEFDVKVWETVYSMLNVSIQSSLNTNTEPENELSNTLNNILSKEGDFPIPAALFYRRNLLDSKSDVNMIENLINGCKKNKTFKSIDEYFIYNQNISMDYFLILSMIAKDNVRNIIEAIRRPVLCIEDRLLNYDAKEKALVMLQLCINDYFEWTTSNDYVCKELNSLKNEINDIERTIIPKLINESYVKYHRKNPMDEFVKSISIKDVEINQKALHIIVTAAIDFMKEESEKYKKINEDIKNAIEILESYIKSQLEKIKEEKSNEVISEDNSEENSVQNSEEKKMIDTQEIMNAVKNTEYSDDDIRLNNIFKSYKWLAELYGVLCNNLEPKISEYQKALKLNIDTAIKFKTKYILTENDDAHLTYLVYKWKNKTIIPRSKWEISIWPGGWILKSENFSFKKLKLLIFSRLNKNVEQLISLIDSKNTSFKYINLIEFYILMYRHFKEWKTNAYDDYDGSMYKYIKNAINNVVITAEDRVRNLEAHELFSMYLMERNNYGIKNGLSPKL